MKNSDHSEHFLVERLRRPNTFIPELSLVPEADGGISLHARSISFKHPVTQETVTITATLPLKDNLWKLFYDGIKE